MRLAAILLAVAFALLATPAWCLDSCCPAGRTAAAVPSPSTLAAPGCCNPAPAGGTCPPSLHRSTNPAADSARVNEGMRTGPITSAALETLLRPVRVAPPESSSPPAPRPRPALHVPLLI
jgi:hypothetical protein